MIGKRFLDRDVRDRVLAGVAQGGAAAPAVAAITDQRAANRLRRDDAGDNGEIAARDGMPAKLHAEPPFRIDGACEDDKPAGLLVEPLHDTQVGPRIVLLACQLHADLPHDEIVEREDEQAAFFEPVLFSRMAYRADAGGLLDDDDMLIDIANRNLIDMNRRPLLGTVEYVHGVPRFQPPSVIEPNFAIDPDPASFDELAHLGPALARQPEPQTGGERLARVFGGDEEGLILRDANGRSS